MLAHIIIIGLQMIHTFCFERDVIYAYHRNAELETISHRFYIVGRFVFGVVRFCWVV